MSVSSRRIPAWLLAVLLPIAAFAVWRGFRQDPASEGEELPSKTASKIFAGKFSTEERWLVDETARDIAEMLAFAKNPANALEFSVKPKSEKVKTYELQARLDGSAVPGVIELKEYVWSPSDHAVWAKALIAAWKLAPAATSTTDEGLLKTLTEPTPEILQRAGKRIAVALTKAPLDAQLHEQAALVTAAFALREAAGEFADNRRELCRIAAHLAIARGLQPDAAGPVRPFAEAALASLAGRETPALAALAKLPASAPGAASWMRALRFHCTGDWRPAEGSMTLFENLENFRARANSVESHFAITWIAPLKPPDVHDWRRLVLENRFGVEDGHDFAKESIQGEIASLKSDWALFTGKDLPERDMIKALNEPAGRSVDKDADGHPAVRVLGWDFWGAQHQRHLLEAIRASNIFFRNLWGVPEYRELQKFAKKKFSALTLFPLLERELTDSPADLPAIAAHLSALIAAHPEITTPALWSSSNQPCGKELAALNVPDPAPWFQPLVPFGTAYNFGPRSRGFSTPADNDVWWNQLLALAPDNFEIHFAKIWKNHSGHPPAAVAEAHYNALADFHFNAVCEIAKAQKDDPIKYAATMQRVCALDAGRYFALGKWLREHGKPEEAAEAYQKGVDLAEDRVSAANECGWLVKYLEDHGKFDKALEVAAMAAEVYSYRGLETMARLQERRGQLKQAEDWLKKIAERYEDSNPLLGFYARHRGEDAQYGQLAADAERKVFPQGLKKVVLADFRGVPESGAALVATNSNIAKYHLKKGDVLVALDGYRVGGRAQYLYVRNLSDDDTKLRIIAWDGSTYREIEADLPNRKLGVELSDFPKK